MVGESMAISFKGREGRQRLLRTEPLSSKQLLQGCAKTLLTSFGHDRPRLPWKKNPEGLFGTAVSRTEFWGGSQVGSGTLGSIRLIQFLEEAFKCLGVRGDAVGTRLEFGIQNSESTGECTVFEVLNHKARLRSELRMLLNGVVDNGDAAHDRPPSWKKEQHPHIEGVALLHHNRIKRRPEACHPVRAARHHRSG